MRWLEHLSLTIGALGVAVIAFGVAIGAVRFVRSEIAALRGLQVAVARRELRHALGYYLLLGLEFLIAADIVDTLNRPDAQELIALGAIVTIRTVIGYSLNAELRQCADRPPTPAP